MLIKNICFPDKKYFSLSSTYKNVEVAPTGILMKTKKVVRNLSLQLFCFYFILTALPN